MTVGSALNTFWSTFGLTAYASTSVPDDVVFPYLTYEYYTGMFEDGEVAAQVNLWYYTDSEAEPNAKAEALGQILRGGYVVPVDDGAIIIRRGSPWCQSLTDEVSPTVKRRLLNVTYEFIR